MGTPTLVYDDDCGFCTWWADFVADRSEVRAVGFSELGPDLRERLPDDYEECAHLVTDDAVYSCGESIEQALVRTELGEDARPLVSLLRQFEDYGRVRERAYRWVADNRSTFGALFSKTPPAGRDGDR
jgi:predicted DCC family thiol-disulfide oxidoreductase YuxK